MRLLTRQAWLAHSALCEGGQPMEVGMSHIALRPTSVRLIPQPGGDKNEGPREAP